jgi:hypothetical protein
LIVQLYPGASQYRLQCPPVCNNPSSNMSAPISSTLHLHILPLATIRTFFRIVAFVPKKCPRPQTPALTIQLRTECSARQWLKIRSCILLVFETSLALGVASPRVQASFDACEHVGCGTEGQQRCCTVCSTSRASCECEIRDRRNLFVALLIIGRD